MKGTKELKTNKGITLIALVITIIVMLILVAVSITMAVNGGLFEQAGRATAKTNNALIAEGQLAEGGVKVGENWYNTIDEYLIATGIKTEPVELISKEKSYVGCYADVDGDGDVDGVIYADLAFSYSDSYYNDFSYEATPGAELKDYYVSKTYDGVFNEKGKPKEVIKATGTGGEKDRFYVMALEDFGEGPLSYHWYYSAYENEDVEIVTTKGLGAGKQNTITMIEKWNAEAFGTKNGDTKNNIKDIWGPIQDSEEYDIVKTVNDSGKWFVPSPYEWMQVVNVFNLVMSWEEEMAGPGYGTPAEPLGLGSVYWTSSMSDANNVYCIDNGPIGETWWEPNGLLTLRLFATF